MSVPVDLAQLTQTLRDFGEGYLLTVGGGPRAHAVTVRPVLDGDALRVGGLGRRTRTNLEKAPEATLLYPPLAPGGYSLIIDGRVEDRDGVAVVVPERAVLHRPAEPGAAASATGCGSDCVPREQA
jgi:hypothetical protein